MANLTFSTALGRLIRIDEPPGELGRSTLLEISDAIDRGDAEGNRVVVAFDPCGSGGRARRGDPARGVPPATERPEFGFSEGAHDWTWRREGVCLYCSHCALVNEILPIERLGFPMRVTEYP